ASAADGPPPTAGRAGSTSAPAAPGGSPGTPVTATPGVDVMTPPGGTARDQHDGADRGRGRLTRRRNGVARGDAAEVAEPRARTGSPLAPATGPSPSPSPRVAATPEPDLFR